MAKHTETVKTHVTLEVEWPRPLVSEWVYRATGNNRRRIGDLVVLGQTRRHSPRQSKHWPSGRDFRFTSNHKERKDDVANGFRKKRAGRDRIVFICMAQEKTQAYNGKKVNGQFQFNRDKTPATSRRSYSRSAIPWGPSKSTACSESG